MLKYSLPALLLLNSFLPALAQSETAPAGSDPVSIRIDDTSTAIGDGFHQSVMKTFVRLGYQIDLFGEQLRLPNTEIEEITAGGVVYHAPRIGGMYRLSEGPLKDAYIFSDYTFLSQPVKNQLTGDTFTRSTHFLDAGIGYFYPLVEDRIEIAPYIGMSAQFNLNDRQPEDDSIYYHRDQSRVGFGLGSQFAARFDDALPFPLFLFMNAAIYPLTPVISDAQNAVFPDNLTVLHFTGSFYGRFLPYLGGEVGFRQQFHLGNNFNASWSEFFAMVRFEPEVLLRGELDPGTPDGTSPEDGAEAP
ncbi:MAG: hypothetical protein IGS03_12315 [Candidatus Sericytochromatia bacterium]|nr:hypothetical protein [Candidatus Sericytochromatia bacterium]